MRTKCLKIWVQGLIFLLGVTGAFLSGSLEADDGPFRTPTKAERDFFRNVLDTFVMALPRLPEGWENVRFKGTEPRARIETSSGSLPMLVEFRWACRRGRFGSSFPAAPVEPGQGPDGLPVDPEISVTEGVLASLTSRLASESAQGNQPEMEEIHRQIEVVKTRLEMLNEKAAKRISRDAAAKPADIGFEIYLAANSFEFTVPKGAERRPAGAESAFWVFEPEDAEEPGAAEVTVLLGPWKEASGETGLEMRVLPGTGLPNTAVQCVLFQLRAEADLCRRFVSRVDWNMLESLIQGGP